jgi:hypothetical protein
MAMCLPFRYQNVHFSFLEQIESAHFFKTSLSATVAFLLC